MRLVSIDLDALRHSKSSIDRQLTDTGIKFSDERRMAAKGSTALGLCIAALILAATPGKAQPIPPVETEPFANRP